MTARLWPDSLGGRTVLVLVLVVVASQAIGLMLYARDRADALNLLSGRQVAERVASITRLMIETPPAGRANLVAALDGPTLRVTLDPRPGLPATAADGHFADRLARVLPAEVTDLRVRVSRDGPPPMHPPPHGPGGHRGRPHPPPLPGDVPLFQVALALPDGTWLNINAAGGDDALWQSQGFLAALAITALVALVAGAWVVRRSTAPLGQVARAADRLGTGLRTEPLAESGPGEVRRVAHAFNRMQDRILRYVADRTRMLAAISHDLRTPLTRMRLRAEFVADADTRTRLLADIGDMERMVEATLAFARDDANEAVEPVDLSALLESLVDEAADTGAEATFTGPRGVTLPGRPLALERAFNNLIANALRYGHCAHVTLNAGDTITITLTDRGPGIPADQRATVFEPFQRLDPSRSRETGGTGLGLTIARSFIREHGGDITLDDAPGGGLRVLVTLPGRQG